MLFSNACEPEILRGLDDEILIDLSRSAIWKVFVPDAVVFWEGGMETNLYYLQYGSLIVLKTSPDGCEQVLRFLDVGDIFNEIGVFGHAQIPPQLLHWRNRGSG